MLQIHSDRLLYYTYALLSVSTTQQLSCYSYTLIDCYSISHLCLAASLYFITQQLSCYSYTLTDCYIIPMPCCQSLSHNSYHVTVTLWQTAISYLCLAVSLFHTTAIMLQLHSDRLLYHTYALLSVSITQQLSCYSYTLIDCYITPMPCCQSLSHSHHATVTLWQTAMSYLCLAVSVYFITQQLSCYSYTLTDCYIIPMPCCQSLLYHTTTIMLQLHSDRLLYHIAVLLSVCCITQQPSCYSNTIW